MMPRGWKIELDHDGMRRMLIENCASVIAEVTAQVAAGAEDYDEEPYPVVWGTEVTDRARGFVSIPAPAQAKRGSLTKAAQQAGLEVTAADVQADRSARNKRRAAARKAAETRREGKKQ